MKISGSDYDEAPVRASVVALAQFYGGPALDVGTGACACMAVALARNGLRVTAIDIASSAVYIAWTSVARELADLVEVCHADAARLRLSDRSYPVVVAFDSLCHAADPAQVLSEMFRVRARDGAVIVVELNTAGRAVTRHLDGGFEGRLPGLLASHCQACRQLTYPYHAIWVCDGD